MTDKERKKLAQAKYNELIKSPPSPYTSSYSKGMDDALKKIESLPAFKYDPSKDKSYGQYKKSYLEAGKAAKDDAYLNARALSGGYENSYADTVGDLVYAQYIKDLKNALPRFEEAAYNRYSSEKENLHDNFDMYKNAESMAKKQYDEEVSRYYDTLNYWAKLAKYMR